MATRRYQPPFPLQHRHKELPAPYVILINLQQGKGLLFLSPSIFRSQEQCFHHASIVVSRG